MKDKMYIIFQNFLFLTYVIFTLVFFHYSINLNKNFEFSLQLFSLITFILFFLLGKKFSVRAFLLFVFIYQFSLSIGWSLYWLNHKYLLDNNMDWITYVKWASISRTTNYFDDFFRAVVKQTSEFSDWGYPIFLYLPYKITSTFESAFFLSVIKKVIFFTIGTWYLYKLSLHFTNRSNAKIIFLLWALNPAAIFFNGINLKESVFVTICIFAVYSMIIFRDSKNPLYFFLFLIFTVWTAFFRVFVTFFIFATFLASTIFRKFMKKYFLLIWILVAILGIVTIKILTSIIPALGYFLTQSLGGESGISIPILIITAMVSPIPALNQVRTTPDNFLVIGYSIFTIVLSFFALYEIFLICKQKKENLYSLLFLFFFNKLLVIVSARSNEYRFQYPLAFAYIILMVLGFYDVYKSGFSLLTKRKFGLEIISIIVILISVSITVMYNGV